MSWFNEELAIHRMNTALKADTPKSTVPSSNSTVSEDEDATNDRKDREFIASLDPPVREHYLKGGSIRATYHHSKTGPCRTKFAIDTGKCPGARDLKKPDNHPACIYTRL